MSSIARSVCAPSLTLFSDHSKLLHSSWPTMMSEGREDRERCGDRARARRPCLKAQRVGRPEMMSACCLFSVCLSVCLTVSLSAGSAMAGSAPCSSCSYPCPSGEGSADADHEETDLDVFPDGYDHRRDIYSGDRDASLDPLSAYHLATHTPHLKSCPICVQANTRHCACRLPVYAKYC